MHFQFIHERVSAYDRVWTRRGWVGIVGVNGIFRSKYTGGVAEIYGAGGKCLSLITNRYGWVV